MTRSVLLTCLLLFSLSAPFWCRAEDSLAVVDTPNRFDCQKQGDHSHLDLFYLGDPSGQSRVLFSGAYYFSQSLEDDYLTCHRTLALAEAYQVNVSANRSTGQLSIKLDANQNPNLLPSKPELLKCEISPENSSTPDSMTITYGEHVIYRDYAFFGYREWVNWLNSCNKAREHARANGGLVLVNLITWQFTVAIP